MKTEKQDKSHVPYTVEVLDKLRWNAHLGKHKHFEAGGRERKHHIKYGTPIIVINIVLGSVLFGLLSEDKLSNEAVANFIKWAGAALSLIAATLGGIQTFFNFEKQCIEHRAVANEYLGIARECERLIALYFDGLLNLDQLSSHIDRLNKVYAQVNMRAEGLTVSREDYKTALTVQEKKKK